MADNKTELRSKHYVHHANANTAIDIFASNPDTGTEEMFNAEIHVLGAGDVALEREDGGIVGPFPVPVGYILPMQVRRIRSTAEGTTATHFLVLY